MVGGLYKAPVSGKNPDSHALLDCREEGSAVCLHEILDNFFVTDVQRFEQCHADHSCPIFSGCTMVESTYPLFRILPESSDNLVELAAAIVIGHYLLV